MTKYVTEIPYDFEMAGCSIGPALALQHVMKAVLVGRSLLGSLIFTFLTVGCSKTEKMGPARYLLPWPEGNGQYSPQEIEIKTLHNENHVSGAAAQMIMAATLSGKDSGYTPNARVFEAEDGLRIPGDAITGQLLTVYAHMERLWDFDKLAGIGDVLSRPRMVGIEGRFGASSVSGLPTRNNAMYLPSIDFTIFTPYEGENLPVAINAGVIAHEYFHSLFTAILLSQPLDENQKQALKSGLMGACDLENMIFQTTYGTKIEEPGNVSRRERSIEEYNSFVLRAFNEGLADVWGWLYTGDENFIVHSLPAFKELRTLKSSETGFVVNETTVLDEFTKKKNDGELGAYAYVVGTTIARSLKRVAPQLSLMEGHDPTDRVGVAKYLTRSIKEMSTFLASEVSAKKRVSVDTAMALLVGAKPSQKLNSADCDQVLKNIPSTQIDKVKLGVCQ